MARVYFSHRIEGDVAVIDGADAHHICTVLRHVPGDRITVCDGAGTEYGCTILSCRDEEIRLQILTKGSSDSESSVRITLYQALPKGDKMDTIVEKAVELGAVAVIPFLSEFCISRPDRDAAAKKVRRWQKRMESAAKQSGRGMIPLCGEVLTFDQMVQQVLRHDKALFCYERSTAPLAACLGDLREGSIGVIVGCEGGFSQREADKIREAGIPAVTLGPRILRCETAPLTVLTLIQYLTGNME